MEVFFATNPAVAVYIIGFLGTLCAAILGLGIRQVLARLTAQEVLLHSIGDTNTEFRNRLRSLEMATFGRGYIRDDKAGD